MITIFENILLIQRGKKQIPRMHQQQQKTVSTTVITAVTITPTADVNQATSTRANETSIVSKINNLQQHNQLKALK